MFPESQNEKILQKFSRTNFFQGKEFTMEKPSDFLRYVKINAVELLYSTIDTIKADSTHKAFSKCLEADKVNGISEIPR